MDQLKVILKHVQKYHFWLLSIVAIIAGLVGSMFAARSMSATYIQEKSKIEGKFTSLQAIRSTDPHPNNQWKDGIEKLNGEEKTKVGQAWTQVYNEQKSLLIWPSHLSEDFLKFIAEHPPNAEIPSDLRVRYQNNIKKEFPLLLNIVDAAPFESAKGQGASAGAAAQPAQQYRVIWDTNNETEIRKSLDWDSVPSSAEVRRVQEDLWVYAALLTIIKNVNAEHQYTTPVREIGKIAIGRPAADAFEADKAVEHVKHLAPAGAAPAAAVVPPPDAAATAVKAVDEGRYVDANGAKLPAGTAADKEFKRMPIFLKLKIDQRQITRFLVECANSPLPVEVRQLRINPSKGSSGSSASQQPVGGSKGGTGSEDAAYDVPIELYGIIYIYNEPNIAKPDPSKPAGGLAAPGTTPPAVAPQPAG